MISRLDFQHAQITEVTFPRSTPQQGDRATDDRPVAGPDGSESETLGQTQREKCRPQRWLVSSFKLSIDGIDTKKVSKIRSLTIKVPRVSFGECFGCDNLPVPAKIDFPDIIATMGLPAESLYDWFEDFVIQGNNDDSKEKGGTLEYLTTDLSAPLFSLKFRNVGIFELMPVQQVANADSVPKLLAAMYCETMQFQLP